MINVIYNPPNELIVSGHSGKQGESLTCCTVSTVMNVLSYGIMTHHIPAEEEYAHGYHKIKVKDSIAGKLLVDTAANYLKEYAEEYGTEVNFTIGIIK